MQPPEVTKPATYRDLGPVDIAPLLALVERVSDAAWSAENARKENAFPCFHDTRHIIFRFTPGNRTPLDSYSTPAWDIWASVLTPIMETAIRDYGFRDPAFPKAMLARLAAGARIDRHVDGAGSNLCTHKIHVPLVTNPGALFESGGEVRHLPAGEAVEVNNVGEHSARNDGEEDRIHLIFEVFERDYARDASEQEAPAVRAKLPLTPPT